MRLFLNLKADAVTEKWFAQNLEFVIVGEISWEVSNTGPNVEDTLKLLTFSNAMDQPYKA